MSGVLGQKFKEIDSTNSWRVMFDQIRQETSSDHLKLAATSAKLPENMSLNRYANILPYDHSIVKLSNGAYINASHINVHDAGRSFILTQGPLPITTDTFWLMIWEHGVKCIVMLNRIFEQLKMKCYMYFPGKETGLQAMIAPPSLIFGDFQIDLKQEQHRSFYSVRVLILKNRKIKAERQIIHFQYNSWPDFGVPAKTDDFLEFLYEIRRSELLNYIKHGPVVCHCSAGIGRSGTFLIADVALVLAHKYKDTSKIDIKQMVIHYRRSRMGLIQTPDQLRFAWKAVVDALDNVKWKHLVATTCIESDRSLRSAKSVDDSTENFNSAGDISEGSERE